MEALFRADGTGRYQSSLLALVGAAYGGGRLPEALALATRLASLKLDPAHEALRAALAHYQSTQAELPAQSARVEARRESVSEAQRKLGVYDWTTLTAFLVDRIPSIGDNVYEIGTFRWNGYSLERSETAILTCVESSFNAKGRFSMLVRPTGMKDFSRQYGGSVSLPTFEEVSSADRGRKAAAEQNLAYCYGDLRDASQQLDASRASLGPLNEAIKHLLRWDGSAPPPPQQPNAVEPASGADAPAALTCTIVAGAVGGRGYADGAGAEARFSSPKGLATDGSSLYLCDTGNHVIRKLELASGRVSTVAGTPGVKGHADGPSGTAKFNAPGGLALFQGRLLVADSGNQVLRWVELATGTVSTAAGLPGKHGSTNGKGSAARFFWPDGLAVNGDTVLVVDGNNHQLRTFKPGTGEVAALAGRTGKAGAEDGQPGSFASPVGVALGDGSYWIGDYRTRSIRKVDARTGSVSTVQGLPEGFKGATGLLWTGQQLALVEHENHGLVWLDPRTSRSTRPALQGETLQKPFGIAEAGGVIYVSDMGSHVIHRLVR